MRLRVLRPMWNHLRTRIGLLEVVGHGHRVKLADRIVAREEYSSGISR